MPETDAEMRVHLSLNLVVRGAFEQHATMQDRAVDEIRLMTEQDAGKGNARRGTSRPCS